MAFAPLTFANLSKVQAVFTDVDGTLTSAGLLKSSTIQAIERLGEAGISTVLVTGRPAGFGECWVRTLPVVGVIVENGALYFARNAKGRLKKVYAQSTAVRQSNRRRLTAAVAKAMKAVPGALLSSDSLYTEVDLAIDYNEECHLGDGAADLLEKSLRAQNVQAVRSSVHVNCWIGGFDKLFMVRKFIEREWKTKARLKDNRFAYVGDSFNDAPMFGAFALSFGVANVLDIRQRLDAPPKFVTGQREGAGFEELTSALLKASGSGGRRRSK